MRQVLLHFALFLIGFRLMATHFFFNSKKEVGKKMPPLKLMPLRGDLRSSPLVGTK
jgi:hypothetical protein